MVHHFSEGSFIFNWYVIALDLVTLTSAIAWQSLGAAAIAGATKKIFPESLLRWWLAWLVWPIFSGALALSLWLVGLGNRGSLIAISFVVIFFGFRNIPKRIWLKTSWSWQEKSLLALILLRVFGFLIYSAIPQEMYDQLNYSLVVPQKFFLKDGFQSVLDPHVLMTGLLEWGLAFPHSWLSSDVFTWGFGQCSVAVHVIGMLILFAVGVIQDRKFSQLNALFFTAFTVIVFPIALPESPIFRIVKPDSFLLLVPLLCIFTLAFFPQRIWSVVALVTPILLAAKFTGIHGAIAIFIAVLLTTRFHFGKNEWICAVLGGLCIALVFLKNWILLSNPLYPALLEWFPSPFVDENTIKYWSRGHAHWWSGLLGYLNLMMHFDGVAFLAVMLMLIFLLRKRNFAEWKLLGFSAKFLLIFVLIWPMFYVDNVMQRFVISGMAPLVFAILMVAAKFIAMPKVKWANLILILPLFSSGMDIHWDRISQWSPRIVNHLLGERVEAFRIAEFLNARFDEHAMVVSDGPLKFLFHQKFSFFHDTGSPKERAITAALSNDPKIPIKQLNIVAFVTYENSPLDQLVRTRWNCAASEVRSPLHVYLVSSCQTLH